MIYINVVAAIATLRIGRPVCSFSHRLKFVQTGPTNLIWIKVGNLVGLPPR